MIKNSIWFLLLAAVTMMSASPASAQKGFGKSVLIAAGEIFVGESDNVYRSGAVHVYGGAEDGWAQRAELTAPDARMGDHFGQSVARDGDLLVVGSTGGEGHPGAAYVFSRSGGAWTYEATLAPEGIVSEDQFGLTVAVSGDFAFVGAPAGDEAPGIVYVYERGGDGAWTESTRLEGSSTDEGASFGRALAADGDRVFVGAPDQNDASGGVYVYEYDGSNWIESRLLEGRITDAGDRYGASLDVDAGDLIVGVPLFGNRVGGAIVYRLSPETDEWQSANLLLPYSTPNAPSFGSAVAMNGDEVWVGAPQGAILNGSAYRFIRAGDDFSASTSISTSDLQRGDRFGNAVTVDGDVAVVAAIGDDYGAGSVVVFERDESGNWSETQTLRSASVGLEPVTGGAVMCDDGAAGMFDCSQVNLLAFLPISELGGDRGVQLNDIWGWTDPDTGREYALVGRVDGTSFVDVTDPSNPRFLGDLPKTPGSPGSAWRDIKVYENHAFIVADNAGRHGMQVFDLTQLRTVGPEPMTFEPTALYDKINSSHNIVINTDTGFAYSVGNSGGGETCGGGLHMIDVQDPTNPTFAGCYAAEGTGRAGTGYTHDAQCLIYAGPDQEYVDREICFGSNETAFHIADVTEKKAPVGISTASYPNVAYTHQGWISDDHRYFYVNDELDEVSGNVDETRTLIWDITDLDDPQLVREYSWGNRATDHNLYIRGDLMYQSNYVSGLRIHDISDPENPREVGFFDTMPVGDDAPGFAGSWSNYPFFESGTIIVSSIDEGLFLLQKNEELGL
ncbi:MAG: choice-of-anchor B family protein [Rhodothermales bacterium]